jgi:hypothetical protein
MSHVEGTRKLPYISTARSAKPSSTPHPLDLPPSTDDIKRVRVTSEHVAESLRV